MDIQDLSEISRDQYCEFLSGSDCSVYNQPDWIDRVCRSKKLSVKFFAVGDNTSPSACVIFYQSKFFPRLIYVSPAIGVFNYGSGVSYRIGLTSIERGMIGESLIKYFSKKKYLIKRLILDEFEYDPSENARSTYSNLALTSIVSCKRETLDEVHLSFKGRARTANRKAIKNGVIVSQVSSSSENIEMYYNMYVETFRRRGVSSRHDLATFRALFCDNESLEVLVASVDGDIAGVGLFIRDSDRYLYVSGSSSVLGFKTEAQTAIIFKAIEMSFNYGLDFDLGGLGVESINKFKYSFNGKVVARPVIESQSHFFDFIKKIYQFYMKWGS